MMIMFKATRCTLMSMLINDMMHKQAPRRPPQPIVKVPTRACVLRGGGGVALRINSTAAASDTDKPQTGSRNVVKTYEERYKRDRCGHSI